MEAQPRGSYKNQFNYKQVLLYKNEPLGHGSYGAVCKAKCDELPCAAKLLFPVLFKIHCPPATPDDEHPQGQDRSPLKRFEQECHFLSLIKHPHIIQYLGTYRDPDTSAPILLMELMDESLTTFLESQDKEVILFHVRVNILQDVALALTYLHSNDIIHRDLSSNNVLLIAGCRAKVTDFGMSKLADATGSQKASLTQCPGTAVYMPPEALDEPPVYTKKIDCFSFGVLMVQTLTRLFPKPTDRFTKMEVTDPRNPRRKISAKFSVPEVDRRSSHIEIIDKDNLLLPLALSCLEDDESKRPSAKDICISVEGIRDSTQYTESICRECDPASNQSDAENIKQLEQELKKLQMELQVKDHMIEVRQNQYRRKLSKNQDENAALRRELETKTVKIQDLERQVQSQQRDTQSPTTEHPQEISRGIPIPREASPKYGHAQSPNTEYPQQIGRDVTIRRLTSLKHGHTLSPNTEYPQKIAREVPIRRRKNMSETEQKSPPTKTRPAREIRKIQPTSYHWRKGMKAPSLLRAGSIIVHKNSCYCLCNKEMYVFKTGINRWTALPDCPQSCATLALVRNIVTAVGGYKPVTNVLLSLMDDINGLSWQAIYPSMHHKRTGASVENIKNKLLVAGGREAWDRTTTVEILNMSILQWSVISPLPYPLSHAKAVISNGSVYLIGGEDQISGTNQVLICSIERLLSTDGESSASEKEDGPLWRNISNLPVCFASGVVVGDTVLAIGGKDAQSNVPSTAVYAYDRARDFWKCVNNIRIARASCLAGVVDEDKLIVIGGDSGSSLLDDVEIGETTMRIESTHTL